MTAALPLSPKRPAGLPAQSPRSEPLTRPVLRQRTADPQAAPRYTKTLHRSRSGSGALRCWTRHGLAKEAWFAMNGS